MTRVPQPYIARGRRLVLKIAVAAMLSADLSLMAPASAQTFGSSYTSTAPKDCRVTSAGNEVDDSTIRVCPRRAGLVVVVSEDDLRETVSVGRNRAAADEEPAAQARFGPFNDGRMAHGERKALCHHPALAYRRQQR